MAARAVAPFNRRRPRLTSAEDLLLQTLVMRVSTAGSIGSRRICRRIRVRDLELHQRQSWKDERVWIRLRIGWDWWICRRKRNIGEILKGESRARRDRNRSPSSLFCVAASQCLCKMSRSPSLHDLNLVQSRKHQLRYRPSALQNNISPHRKTTLPLKTLDARANPQARRQHRSKTSFPTL